MYALGYSGLFKEIVRKVPCLVLWILLATQLEACPRGYHGAYCRDRCSYNCLYTNCDATTGSCLDGCKDGFMGTQCESECDHGYYGRLCLLKCHANCANESCNHVTGVCHDGCMPGYTGETCQEACKEGRYGEKCASTCSVNCAPPGCDHVTGACRKGCKGEFWGSDCTLTGDFRDNPQPKRTKFYQQLSAESRSVLLYVLMGEYERTLELAHMEIKKGIRQRNEIHELIGGTL